MGGILFHRLRAPAGAGKFWGELASPRPPWVLLGLPWVPLGPPWAPIEPPLDFPLEGFDFGRGALAQIGFLHKEDAQTVAMAQTGFDFGYIDSSTCFVHM